MALTTQNMSHCIVIEYLIGLVDVDDGLGSVADDEDKDNAGQQRSHRPVPPTVRGLAGWGALVSQGVSGLGAFVSQGVSGLGGFGESGG
jgi:hypothetical protein